MQLGELIERQADVFVARNHEPADALRFRPGVISGDAARDRFDLITPDGARLRLNPRFNRASLVHLRGRPVRALLRASPWPLSRPDHLAPLRPVSKVTYDVLFIERLEAPDEMEVTELSEITRDHEATPFN